MVSARKLWGAWDAKQAAAQIAATKRSDEIWESALEVIQKERAVKKMSICVAKEKQVEPSCEQRKAKVNRCKARCGKAAPMQQANKEFTVSRGRAKPCQR